jgi:hypothetical protein
MSKKTPEDDRGAPKKSSDRDAPAKSAPIKEQEVWPEQNFDPYQFSDKDENMVAFTIHYSYRSQMYKPNERVVLENPDTEFLGRAMRWVNRQNAHRPKKGKAGSWTRAMSELGG